MLPDYVTVTSPLTADGIPILPVPVTPLCRNCKFWGGVVDVTFGQCGNEHLNRHDPEKQTSADTLSDTEVFTGKDFGCIHFENK